eukprot:10334139-Lingulodinium_polyedra.AAC.1
MPWQVLVDPLVLHPAPADLPRRRPNVDGLRPRADEMHHMCGNADASHPPGCPELFDGRDVEP